MMKYIAALLVLCGQCVAQDKVEFSELTGPVLKIRVMQQGRCPKGIPCTPIFVSGGSCVVADVKEAGNRPTYAILTAAHVVTQYQKDQPNGDKEWVPYGQDHYYEVSVNGGWKIATLTHKSLNADAALLTLPSSTQLRVAPVASKRPVKGDTLRLIGYKGGETLTTHAGVCLWNDDSSNSLDAAHKLTEPVSPGESGGAVVNASGELVGLIVGDAKISIADMEVETGVGVFTNQPRLKWFMDNTWNK